MSDRRDTRWSHEKELLKALGMERPSKEALARLHPELERLGRAAAGETPSLDLYRRCAVLRFMHRISDIIGRPVAPEVGLCLPFGEAGCLYEHVILEAFDDRVLSDRHCA